MHRGKFMRTRSANLPALAMALLFVGIIICITRPLTADDRKAGESWKLVVLAFGDDEFALLKLDSKDGKSSATVVDAQQMLLGKPHVKNVEGKGDNFTITLSSPGGDTVFQGTRAAEGPKAGTFLGTYTFRGELYPARLEKTTNEKVGELKQSPLVAKYVAAIRETDPKSKIKKLEEAIKDNHGAPNNQLLYGALLGAAEAAGLDATKVGDLIKQWSEEAKPFGDAWASEVRMKALKSIGTAKGFAKVSLALAQEIDQKLSEDALEKKAAVLEILAKAAGNTGMTDLARDAEARRAKLEVRLDEDYHHKVPPFKPTSYAGRKDSQASQAVLMELFTGAQCPPCVAADVAFDALLQTYKPADFIGLQYHLHIPGPDPLTNKDSLARQAYYGSEVQGTPSTFFNGKSEAGGGGAMGNSEGKYTQYRQIIDKKLEASKATKIELSATRAGDQIKIIASTEAPESGGKGKKDNDKSRQVLRLALTEEAVRYIGGNKLRFHHHVVRAFPGGPKGTELKGGTGKVELTVDLAQLKRDQETYLSDFAKSAPFPNPLPEIKLDDLAVVAFVQDDGDKSVLHAVSVPVKRANP
jgi:hypothetical protein